MTERSEVYEEFNSVMNAFTEKHPEFSLVASLSNEEQMGQFISADSARHALASCIALVSQVMKDIENKNAAVTILLLTSLQLRDTEGEDNYTDLLQGVAQFISDNHQEEEDE